MDLGPSVAPIRHEENFWICRSSKFADLAGDGHGRKQQFNKTLQAVVNVATTRWNCNQKARMAFPIPLGTLHQGDNGHSSSHLKRKYNQV
jgi:hypothetical protein